MRIVGFLLVVLIVASFAHAQSLAELARQEKERRKSNDATTGEVKIYSETDLDHDLEGAEPVESESSSSDEPEDDSGLDDWRDRKQADQSEWRERLARYQERYTEQKQRRAQLARIKTECDRGAMPLPINPTTEAFVENGSYVTWGVGNVTCKALPEMVSEVEQTLRSIEDECRADARKHFIPPAEAVLH